MHLPGKRIQIFGNELKMIFSKDYEFSFTGQTRIDKLLVSMSLKVIVCSLSKGCVKPYAKKKEKRKEIIIWCNDIRPKKGKEKEKVHTYDITSFKNLKNVVERRGVCL